MRAEVLGKMGVKIKFQVMMYKTVAQSVLLYGIQRWVVMDTVMMVMEVFHHSISRQNMGMKVKKGGGGNGSGTWWAQNWS